jgi:hypothetical protein
MRQPWDGDWRPDVGVYVDRTRATISRSSFKTPTGRAVPHTSGLERRIEQDTKDGHDER